MKTIIIRDDDVSCFTDPQQLEKIYARVWQVGIPVSFSVIPAPRGDVRVLHREGQPYDPSISKQYRGQEKSFPLADNPAICEFLNEKAKAGLVQICLHGFDHSYHEFDNVDIVMLEDKLKRGLEHLQTALPDAIIDSFIAPYDCLSPAAFQLLLDHHFNLCTATSSLKSTAYAAMKQYQQRVIKDNQRLFTCDEYFFSHHFEPEACLALAKRRLAEQDLLIIVNHYWTFFYDWNGDWEAMFGVWNQFLDEIFSLDAVEFRTFGKFAPKPL
jgi:hypothetical protein